MAEGFPAQRSSRPGASLGGHGGAGDRQVGADLDRRRNRDVRLVTLPDGVVGVRLGEDVPMYRVPVGRAKIVVSELTSPGPSVGTTPLAGKIALAPNALLMERYSFVVEAPTGLELSFVV